MSPRPQARIQWPHRERELPRGQETQLPDEYSYFHHRPSLESTSSDEGIEKAHGQAILLQEDPQQGNESHLRSEHRSHLTLEESKEFEKRSSFSHFPVHQSASDGGRPPQQEQQRPRRRCARELERSRSLRESDPIFLLIRFVVAAILCFQKRPRSELGLLLLHMRERNLQDGQRSAPQFPAQVKLLRAPPVEHRPERSQRAWPQSLLAGLQEWYEDSHPVPVHR